MLHSSNRFLNHFLVDEKRERKTPTAVPVPKSSGLSRYSSELGKLFPFCKEKQTFTKRKRSSTWGTTSGHGKRQMTLNLPNTWTHKFCCLADPNQSCTPSLALKRSLELSQLGEKKITFEKKASPAYFRREMLKNYPKLDDAGGYELLRSCPTKLASLELVKTNPSYNVMDLKKDVSHAIIYIRPIQKKLDMKVTYQNDNKVNCFLKLFFVGYKPSFQ